MRPESTLTKPDSALAGRLRESLDRLEARGLRRTPGRVERLSGGRIALDGRTVSDFSSNDYLGLASDPRVADALAAAAPRGGTGAGAARLISGNHPLHEELEEAIAGFKRSEAALLFASGFVANAGVIPALTGEDDIVYSDALNHASVVDGCRLSRAEVRIFPHRDLEALSRMLEEDRSRSGERWIVVDGVFSMDGDLFPLDGLVELASAHGARTYVDDAHGTGVLGATGRGSAEHWGVENRIDVVMGTLGKAVGTSGAFVSGPEVLREWLLNRARSFVFTTGTPPALAAATMEALRIVESEPERRERLWRNGARLRSGLETLGIRTRDAGSGVERRRATGAIPGASATSGAGATSEAGRGEAVPEDEPGHITPIVLGDVGEAMRVGRALLERGYHVGTIRPPSVPEGTARLRISLSAAHDVEQIDGLLEALENVLASETSPA